ncbi:MAG: SRPBCC family protein [Candidatus Tyrphobacter sp.]
MSILSPTFGRGMRSLTASVDLESPPEDVFSLLCSVEKWPVWLSFLRSARRVDSGEPIALGSEVVVRSTVPGEEEQLYEVDQFISNHHLSLVGAFSVRRRVEFRVERKTAISRLHVRLSYPVYHGRFFSGVRWWRRGRRLLSQLQGAMTNFKGLVEYRRNGAVLADL